jgi:hypothetical protein
MRIGHAKADVNVRDDGQEVHFEKDQPNSQYLFARLEARVIQRLVELDMEQALALADERRRGMETPERKGQVDPLKFRSIFRIWPDFQISACISKSIATVKADAAHKSFSATGEGITWAVLDSGIDADHRHFTEHGNIDRESTFHRDFTVDGPGPLVDDNGHGTHVAGIIAGEWPVNPDTPPKQRPIAVSRYLKQNTDDVEYQETRLGTVGGMAPRCRLVSLRVLDENGKGSVSNLIAAINHIQEVNGFGRRILIHGVNMSVGYNFEPEWFACGQSPLCVEVDRLVKSGVVVVVAAGNTGYGTVKSSAGATAAGMALTINDPGNADLAITVGATHRDMPHVYGRVVLLVEGADRRWATQARPGRPRREDHLVCDRHAEEDRREGQGLRLRRDQRDEHGRSARQRRDRGVPVGTRRIHRATRARETDLRGERD